jgi:hypothetical protein
MGVLEDAIREHLELKRRHGASEEEVERNELEALGPARREFEGAAEEAPADEVAVAEAAEPEPEEHEPAAEHEAEPLPETEPLPEPEPKAAEQPPLEPPPEPGIAEPATTRLYESPPAEADFAAGEDEEEEEADERSPRDWDFD